MAKANANNAPQAPAFTARAQAPAYKYAKAPKANGAANITFTLTTLGKHVASLGGAGTSGKPTVMGLVAVAAARVAAKGLPLTGANIVAMLRTPSMVAQLTGATKAVKYAPGGTMPCKAWLAGYVNGACLSRHGLLAKATA